ncbi:MAG TPA: hypothetical protein VFH66_06685, partial [Mycobacteriales bacterium]|nr:hypothetical protein [Mycobacteriales bacterium]
MKTITYNAGNASSAKVRADIEALAALKPVAIGLQEVADRRAELANVPGYRTIQENGSVKGHVALLVREDAKPGDPQLHQIGKRTHVGPDVAGARTNGWTAAKYILAVDVTDTDTGKPATVATMHLVPSASHSQAASALLKTQAANAAAWLAEQPLPTDLMGDCNGRAGRHEFAPLRKVATAVSAPSRKGAAIDIHWLKGCAGKPVALDGYSSDHKPVVAVIALPTAAPTPAPKEPVVSTVEKLASIAEGEVGYHEGRSGGHWNNHEKYAAQVPTLAWVSAGGYPWCAVFVCWVFNKAGVLELIPGGPTASVAHFRDAAKAAGRFSEYPAVGAIALYGTAGDAHTGL